MVADTPMNGAPPPIARAASRPLLYVIGSLRNAKVVDFCNRLEVATGYEAFASWYAAGPEADDHWKRYEIARGRGYKDALASHAATHVFGFDKSYLDRAAGVVLLCPAGKSGHVELGYAAGRGTPTFIFLDEEDVRWDVMYRFADEVTESFEELTAAMKRRMG